MAIIVGQNKEMQKITDHKVPNIDEVDELPDINILPVNLINNGSSDEPETSQPEARSSKSTPKRKTSIVVLENEEIEEFEINQAENPRQLLHLVWRNNIRMLGMRGRQEQLECRVDDFHDHGSYFEYIKRSTKTTTGEYDASKARRKYNNKIFRGDGGERGPYLALKNEQSIFALKMP